MVQIIQGFEVNTREAIDNRLVLSKEQMLNTNDNYMPDKYFAVCTEDGYLYIYNKNTTEISEETGKFSKYSYCKIESISVNGTVLPIKDLNVDLPLATADAYGLSIAGKGIKAENGIYTLDFNAIDDKAIPFEKVNFDDVIIDASNI